jgi:murein DD-endopeptidase MepM/ murein hydrolase activator NlpD
MHGRIGGSVAATLAATLSLGSCGSAITGPHVDCALYPPQATSAYVLPYPVGRSYLVAQTTGHYRAENGGVGIFAIDFLMPIGSRIAAARAGTVVAVRDTFSDGNGRDLEENFVFVRHDDGSIGRYIHLTRGGALASVGERVEQGEVIALSGNTGFSAAPHLHFDVQVCGPNLPPDYNQLPCGQTLPLSFRNTATHTCGLRVGIMYLAEPYGPSE